jgi:hypothetical protein
LTGPLLETRTITVSIDCPPDRVYDFVSNPSNLPRWSFFEAVTETDDGWVVQTPGGPVGFRFLEANRLGVLDHRVTLPSGVEIQVPMRVITNGRGSEVLFTLFRASDMTDQDFASDATQVIADLTKLKNVLEGPDAGRP